MAAFSGQREAGAGAPDSRRRGLIGIVVGVALLLVAAAPALADPVLRIDSVTNTTAAPGGTIDYNLQFTNVGSSRADGTSGDSLLFTATLPPGVTAQDVTLPLLVKFFGTGDPTVIGWSCTGDGGGPVAGSSTVTCQMPISMPPSAGFFDNFGFKVAAAITLSASVDPAVTDGTTLTASFGISGGGSALGATVDPTKITATTPGFGLDDFKQQVHDPSGSVLAGGHPDSITTSIDFNTIQKTPFDPNPNGTLLWQGNLWPVEPPRDAAVDLPPGLVGMPAGIPQCTASQLANGALAESAPLCPSDSQVGVVFVRTNAFPGTGFGGPQLGPVPLFNMVPPSNVPARFGFDLAGTVVTFDATARTGSDYGLTVTARNISEGVPIAGTEITFWGVPADSSHDSERQCPGQLPPFAGGPSCQSGAPLAAFLRNPTSCSPPAGQQPADALLATVHADSWVHPAAFVPNGLPDLSDLNWVNVSSLEDLPDDCGAVPFEPKLTAAPSPAAAGEPAGMQFDLTSPQSTNPTARAEADLRDAEVTLPDGVHVSASSANGLQGCSEAQIALTSGGDQSCPDASKIGTVRIDTPLLNDPLTGSIYLASPNANKFGSLLAIYLVAKGPGLVVKLPGEIDADGTTGRLVARFTDQPQLPFSNLHLEFNGGPHAPLVLPRACGVYHVSSSFTAWSGKTATSDSSFTVSGDGNGGACASPATFAPGFQAFTQNPIAGKDSPLVVGVTRRDVDQELGSLTVDLPSGLTGKIASAVLCPDGAANAGSCEDVSKVGSVTVGAGAGPDPFYIKTGRAYITGPYKGAPFGLSIVVPAVAGPFDLGNVVVRAAILVDSRSARLRIVSNPFPTILQGIPLDVRDVRVNADRPNFIVNPTSCAEKRIYGTIASTAGAVAHGSTRFQVGDCGSLPLSPRMSLTVGGRRHTGAGQSTALTATLRQSPGEANLRSVTVVLPGTLNARLGVLNHACTLAEFDTGHCSSRAKAGSAVAVTPLLRDPLRGSAYFVKNPHRVLPDLMVALRGQVSIDLVGKVSVTKSNSLATKFDTIPDVAISKFSLRLVSGTNGPLGVVRSLCAASSKNKTAAISFAGQNGKELQTHQRLRVLGCRRR
jgi:hypothetical protein